MNIKTYDFFASAGLAPGAISVTTSDAAIFLAFSIVTIPILNIATCLSTLHAVVIPTSTITATVFITDAVTISGPSATTFFSFFS